VSLPAFDVTLGWPCPHLSPLQRFNWALLPDLSCPSPRQVFDLFDRDHSSRISTEELAQVLCGDGSDEELCIPDAVPAALRRVDVDGDGYVDFAGGRMGGGCNARSRAAQGVR
jgi:hypothetical protein